MPYYHFSSQHSYDTSDLGIDDIDNLTHSSLYDSINDKNCKGCGVHLQITDPYTEGYVDRKMVIKHINRNLNLNPEDDQHITNSIKRYIEEKKILRADKDSSPDTQTVINVDPRKNQESLERLERNEKKYFESFWRNLSAKSLICLRCAKLKQNNINELTSKEAGFAMIEREKLLHKIFKRINKGMCALFVMDFNDIHGSYANDIIQKIKEKELDLMVVVNKIDTIPKDVPLSFVKHSIRKVIRSIDPFLSSLVK